MAKKYREIQDVKAIDLADKGAAIGKTPEGEVVLLQDGVVPGDVVDIRWKRKKKGLKLAYPIAWKKRSPHRQEPFCKHFEYCGGCSWQNMSYPAQAAYKEKKVRDVIVRIAQDDGQKVGTILSCAQTVAYRNKMEYTFSTKRWLTPEEINSGRSFTNRDALGFHIAGSFDKVLDIEECHLQDGLGNEIRNTLRAFAQGRRYSFYDISAHTGFLRNLIIRNTSLGKWMVIIVFGEERPDDIKELFDHLIASFPSVNSWFSVLNQKQNSSLWGLTVDLVRGDPHIEEKLGDLHFRISPQSFFQTNSYQAVVLYELVKKLAAPEAKDIIYDLYTGTGSIALYLATSGASVVGIETVSEAIADAKSNALMNELPQVDFVVGDVKDVLAPSFQKRFGKPTIVVTDPPRAGMHPQVVESLLDLAAPKIIYISCNPSTQARDIKLLKASYNLAQVIPVDMFPHTSHIESVALLELKTNDGQNL